MCEGAGRPRACASARRKQAALWLKRPPSSMPKTKSRHLPPRVSSVGVFFAPACLVECSTGASAVLPSWFPVGCEGGDHGSVDSCTPWKMGTIWYDFDQAIV